MDSISSNDCPGGKICVDGGCVEPGPGLYEFLDKGNVVEYNPGEPQYKPYELTPEEHKMFDDSGYDDQTIQRGKDNFAKLKGPQKVMPGSLDEMRILFEQLWYEPPKEIKIQRNVNRRQ